MENSTKAIQYAQQHNDVFLAELIDFIAIESVSTDPLRKDQVDQAAQWLSKKLNALNLEDVTVFQTPLHPVVYAQKIVNPHLPTVLIYGHYDVQPEDPIDLWVTSSPFTAEIVENRLTARGASDMKGQVIAGLAAVESILATNEFPVNLKFIYEGEEEIGSPSIKQFLEEHKDLLSADVVLNLDAGMIAENTPTITYALRGLAYFELTITGPRSDLHSGMFGGIVHNPAQVLCEVIAAMKDRDAHIQFPGFYDDVRGLTQQERDNLAALPQTEKTYLEQTGVPALKGESGFTRVEQNTARPTLDVHGLLSGFTGEGAKTVIPSWAKAKFSMRIVPDQKPDVIDQQVRKFLENHVPNTVTWHLKTFKGGFPAYCDPTTPATQAMMDAMETVWKTQPVLKREGASIPIVTEMQEILKVDSVLSGFGLPDDNMHAPNEKLNLNIWRKGIQLVIEFFFKYAALTQKDK